MYRSTVLLVLVAGIAAGSAAARPASAQGNPPGTVTVSSAATFTQEFARDFDGGGDLKWSSRTFSVGVTRQFVPAFAAGFTLRYGYEDWDISSATALGGEVPWQQLQRPGASLNLSLALSRSLLVGVSPTVEWAYDTRADMADACIYGAVVSAAKVFSPDLVMGGGFSVTRQFYSVKATPFVIVNWKLNDRFRLANAAPASLLGGAGVELRYTPAPDWELAAGGVWRSDRWRLAGDGPLRAGVGETSSIPLLGRLSRKLGPKVRLDLYSGATVSNKLTLRDLDGKDLAHDGYGAAPVLSATLSGKF